MPPKNGKIWLEDIFNFLKSEILFNNNKLKHKFITDLEDQIKANKENIIFRYNKEKKIKNQKIGRNSKGLAYDNGELINIKSLKNQFKKTCKNYTIKNDNQLYFKKKIKVMKYNENDNKSSDQKEGLFLLPTKSQLNNFLYQFHISTCHSNYKELKYKFYENKIQLSSYLEQDDTCILNVNFLKLGKNTLIYNGVKKGKFAEKIPVKIIKNTSYGYYLIKIGADYKKYIRTITTGEKICS